MGTPLVGNPDTVAKGIFGPNVAAVKKAFTDGGRKAP